MDQVTLVRHLETLAQGAKGFVGTALKAVTDALKELEGVKADRTAAIPVVIPAVGWTLDGQQKDYWYDIPIEGLSERDRADIILAPGSLVTAKSCGLSITCTSMAGKIRIRAFAVPERSLQAEAWITEGKE